MTETFQNLQVAVETKNVCAFTYNGKARLVVPFMLGRTKDNRTVLQAFQLEEYQQGVTSTETRGWRFFYLDQISSEVVLAAEHDVAADAVEIQKSEGGYKPPAFVTEVLAVAP